MNEREQVAGADLGPGLKYVSGSSPQLPTVVRAGTTLDKCYLYRDKGCPKPKAKGQGKQAPLRPWIELW